MVYVNSEVTKSTDLFEIQDIVKFLIYIFFLSYKKNSF